MQNSMDFIGTAPREMRRSLQGSPTLSP